MGILEMRRHFAAYGSGELPEVQLRNLIRNALSHEPQLGQEFIALTDACRRANLIGARLQSNIRADILEVTAPSFDLTKVRPAGYAGNPVWFDDERAANSTDVHIPPGVQTGYAEPSIGDPVRTAAGAAATTGQTVAGQTVGTGSTSGGSWNVADGLSEAGAPLYPGAVLRERFVLVEELGHGGMGVVYKAFDRSRGDVKDRYVAIKVLSEEFKRHPLAVKALQREARKAQKLAHPNIVAVHDFDRDCGNVYMVMELLSGRSLDLVLREDGQGGIPLGPALDMIKALASALSYAHEHDIVHCDFKPSNAFLGRDGRVKVLDFGIARAAPSLAEKGDVTLFDAGQLGAVSPAYASMELLQGAAPDVRDDVYSFACVVYELLTGSHPYQRIDAVKAAQTGLEPRSIRKLSRSQWRALKQALAFRRADRCPSIDVLARQLLAPRARTGLWIGLGATAAAVAAVGGAFVWKGAQIQQAAAGWITDLRVQHGGTTPPVAKQGPATAAAPPQLSEPQLSVPPGSESPGGSYQAPPAGMSRAPSAGTYQPSSGSPSQAASGSTYQPSSAGPSQAASAATYQPSSASPSQTSSGGTYQPSSARPSALPVEVGPYGSPPLGVRPTSVATATSPAAQTTADKTALERNHVEVEMLREQFETQAIAGDVEATTKTAAALNRLSPGSAYTASDVPRILTLTYQRRAKTQFMAGQVNEALQTLAEGRRKFGRSQELRDQEVAYVAAADLYDRISSAVVLNPIMTRQGLDDLKASQGEDFPATAKMLAQTLADRIADHRAAGRTSVADKLAETGRQLFPDYTDILGHGEAGKLASAPIEVTNQ